MTTTPRMAATFVPWNQVRLEEGFWKDRQEINRKVTLPAEYRQCRDTGRLEAIKLTWKPGQPNQPHNFWDSDVAKWIEAAAYSLALYPDRRLRARVDQVVKLYEQSQAPDGYINSYFRTLKPKERWTDLRRAHELYTAGHLMEAAAAHFRATGDRRFLEVMCRFADHIDRTFGLGRGKKKGYPGHQEIELALVKLFDASGQERYLRLARYFIEQRGRKPLYFEQEARASGDVNAVNWGSGGDSAVRQQAHLPVRQQKEIVGHAVRALYMLSGMVDVAAHSGDASLWKACRQLWHSAVGRRMYLTGGVGSSGHGERFTLDYDLPNENAYAETCAAIALVLVAQRMLRVEADAQYADVMERALYNGVISGVSLSGDRFFYINPLRAHPRRAALDGRDGHRSVTRQKWFGCACCPPNIARLLASLGGYIYATTGNTLQVHLYAASRASLELAGQRVNIQQITDYPWSPRVKLAVDPAEPRRFGLALRIPGWCKGAALKINGKSAPLGKLQLGYAMIHRVWKPGDRVELNLPMPVRRTYAHPACRANLGMVALERGPIVYCLEQADNGPDLHRLSLPRSARLTAHFEPRLLGGVVVVKAMARKILDGRWSDRLYAPDSPTRTAGHLLKAVPYALWNNRGEGEMTVWMREEG